MERGWARAESGGGVEESQILRLRPSGFAQDDTFPFGEVLRWKAESVGIFCRIRMVLQFPG